MSVSPDFERIRTTLLLKGEPDRVPNMEQTVDRDVKKAYMGKPIETLEDEVEFWMTAGFRLCSPGRRNEDRHQDSHGRGPGRCGDLRFQQVS